MGGKNRRGRGGGSGEGEKQRVKEGESRRERDGGMEARMRGENDHGREEEWMQ